MITKALKAWLKAYELTPEQTLLALLAAKAAAELDANYMTATHSEFRRTVQELARQLNTEPAEFDPLTDLLKR